MILHGDCLEQLKTLESDSIDSLVTDPPAGISFMGKAWDDDKGGRKQWISWMGDVMRECLRVMKPGAHGLVWAIPRTSHWTATALEDAGFEVRDKILHLFGQGFPKSLDISKAIDKAAGAERVITDQLMPGHTEGRKRTFGKNGEIYGDVKESKAYVTIPSTDAAKQWQGYGTALKPAVEEWILVRKPLSEKTVASNVLKHGTGGLNIDGSRVKPSKDYGRSAANSKGTVNAHDGFDGKAFKIAERNAEYASPQGRFPANLVLSHTPYCTDDQCDIECAIKQLDEQSGKLASNFRKNGSKISSDKGGTPFGNNSRPAILYADSGGASRFFYCAKISSSERNAGMGDLKNNHPTIKSKKLMGYLIKLITPPQGIVLDPFMGSGSTGIAAKENGFQFIGIEKEPEYFQIATARIQGATCLAL